MSITRRIISGTIANSAGIGMNALLQIMTVPILALAWGQEKFGLWMMLTTIPTYFALTDLGFVQAATSDMTMKTARGEKESALETFQSIWLMFLGTSIALICASCMLFLAKETVMDASSYWVLENAPLVVMLIAYSALSLLSRVTLAGFRSTGNYAIGSFVYDALVLMEGLAGLFTAYAGGGFFAVVATLIAMRLGSMAAYYLFLRHRVPWLYYGFSHASVKELKRLFAPAIAAITIPVALAVNLQGVVLVVGTVLSPASVAIFTPVRTASRLVIQIIGVVNRATMPEIGRAAGANAGSAMSRLVKLNIFVVVAMLVPGGIAFAVFGQDIIALWSGGKLVPPRTFVALMALAMVMHGAWYFASNVLLATNSHASMAKYLLGSSLISLGLAFVFAQEYGLIGVAISAALSELINSLAVLWNSPAVRIRRSKDSDF